MKNIHLIISVFVVIPVALIYGFQPDLLFDIHSKTTDENNLLKAIMGLYLSFSMLWILGIVKPIFWKSATISNMLFMFGLAFGRTLSIIFDGIPSTLFILGTVGEFVLGIYAFLQFKRFIDSP